MPLREYMDLFYKTVPQTIYQIFTFSTQKLNTSPLDGEVYEPGWNNTISNTLFTYNARTR